MFLIQLSSYLVVRVKNKYNMVDDFNAPMSEEVLFAQKAEEELEEVLPVEEDLSIEEGLRSPEDEFDLMAQYLQYEE